MIVRRKHCRQLIGQPEPEAHGHHRHRGSSPSSAVIAAFYPLRLLGEDGSGTVREIGCLAHASEVDAQVEDQKGLFLFALRHHNFLHWAAEVRP